MEKPCLCQIIDLFGPTIRVKVLVFDISLKRYKALFQGYFYQLSEKKEISSYFVNCICPKGENSVILMISEV